MLGGQLRDRARVLRKPTAARASHGGKAAVEPVPGPWFRCAYGDANETEIRSAGGIRRRYSGITLVCGRRALDGSEIEIQASDELEIESTRHGSIRVGVEGKPERMTRGRTWIGWLLRWEKTNRDAS